MRKLTSKLLMLAAMLAVTGSVAFAAPSSKELSDEVRTNERVRRELVTLPFYGVFDNLAFKREGSIVTLYGQVVRPTTRSDAEARVKRLEGVERVVNQIEVLPLSSFDDDIRLRTYRAVFGTSGLYRYAMGASPSVHIIVKGGRVTLEGVVGNRMDKQLAYMAARGVPGVFEVTDNLRAPGEEGR